MCTLTHGVFCTLTLQTNSLTWLTPSFQWMRSMRLSNLFIETWLARKRARSRIENVKFTNTDQEAGKAKVSAFSTLTFSPISRDN